MNSRKPGTAIELFRRLPSRPFFFVRHGQTGWNAERRLQGQSDIHLNSEGLKQAGLAAAHLQQVHLDLIVSSPLRRAVVTAEIIAESHSAPIVLADALKERNFGSFTGMKVQEVQKQYELESVAEIHDLNPADGESFEEMAGRFFAQISIILRENGGEVLIVGHGGLFRSFMWVTRGQKSVCPNAVPYLFRPRNGSWDLVKLSDYRKEA